VDTACFPPPRPLIPRVSVFRPAEAPDLFTTCLGIEFMVSPPNDPDFVELLSKPGPQPFQRLSPAPLVDQTFFLPFPTAHDTFLTWLLRRLRPVGVLFGPFPPLPYCFLNDEVHLMAYL